MTDPKRTASLKATYTSPTNALLTLTTPLTLPPSLSVAEKTAYLSSLRGAVTELQGRVNAELTARMEEDNNKAGGQDGKTQEGKGGKAGKKSKAAAAAKAIDEDAEEENYGEEVVEED